MKYEDFRLLMQVIHMLREWKRWNILPKALKVDSSPPLSHSDHYPNQPIPTFRSALKRNKPISKSVTEEEPSGCFPAMMAWDVLRQLYWYCGSDRRVLSFLCRHCGATIRIYPNNKRQHYTWDQTLNQMGKKTNKLSGTELRAVQRDLAPEKLSQLIRERKGMTNLECRQLSNTRIF